jgi:release factor glutamine methyltransferase
VLGTDGLCVDLCAGTGALGFSVAVERPGTAVHLVERSPRAYRWLGANLAAATAGARPRPRCHLADVVGVAAPAGALAELVGRVDAVVTNPPYLRESLRASLEPEVRDWDPPEALFAGPDGLAVVRQLLPTAARLLRPGGLLALEHGDDQQPAVLELLRASGWVRVRGHLDLARRPRFVTALRS